MSFTVKVFYERSNGQKEIRRFVVNTNLGSDSFLAVKERVKELYPVLAHGHFQLFWQDPEGDRIVFSTTDELREALENVSDGILRVYIPESKVETQPTHQAGEIINPEKSKKPQQHSEEDQKKTQQQQPEQGTQKQSGKQSEDQSSTKNGVHHPFVTCDGCEGQIYGIRYKCCVCHDYDLCSSCEGKGIHTMHDMFKITEPKPNMFDFLPPHIGRRMHRYMRRGENGASSCASPSASTKAEAATNNADKAAQKSASEHFLSQIGENIAAFMDPFGIDVSYDVHNNGDQCSGGKRGPRCGNGRGDGCGNRRRDECGNRRGDGCYWKKDGGPSLWGFCPAWQEMEKRFASEKNKDKSTESRSEMETDAKIPEPTPNQDMPMDEENVKVPKSNSSDEWTIVSEGESKMETTNSSTPIPMPYSGDQTFTNNPEKSNQPSAPLLPSAETQNDGTEKPKSGTKMYPDLRIQQSLDQMLAMGFANTDNWLSDLLIQYNGDIGLTLDAVKAKATQQLGSLHGPH